ncbi:PHD finger protein 21Aa isoform X1 [Electrophorus electricus]|uniref:PHD finger protein 21Aa isoform X1 n=1 Tax=Electrophorus electricus TaxID=8005 RepID=UPI0015D02101|nr:PHD finger protein 21Aa isoform X1 [Electrophorus electricus]
MVFKTADVVKAEGGVGFGQKGLMMELQSLQEALKVEIQIHQKLVAQMKQDPQNAELKMQLHDLQAKITALSERQKKVVEQLRRDLLVKQESSEIRLQTQTQLPLQADGKTTTLVSSQSQTSLPPTHLSTPQNSVSVTPVISTKTLPLMLRAATPTTPIAMMPTPTIAMVTTLTNTPLPSLPNSDPQNLPVSLQTSCKPANQGMEPVRIVPKNTIVVQTATQPIKVPQFVPPTRQTARPASLPQVMPKPPAPVTPAVLQPVLTSPQPLQQPVYLTAKLSSTLLPSSGPVHQLHIFSPQPGPAGTQACPPNPQACLSNTQPGAVVIQPNAGVTQPGPVITQTAMTLSTNISQFSVSSVQHSSSQLPSIHISAQTSKPQPSPASTSTETPHSAQSSDPCPDTSTLSAVGRVEPKTAASSLAALQTPASTSTVPATPTEANTHGPAQSPEPKRQDNPLKLAFMVSLGLVTHDYLEEIQSKRQERKRRTTANPVYSGAVFEPERKKSTVSYLNSANQGCRKRGRPPKHSSAVERGTSPMNPTSCHAAAGVPQQPSAGSPHPPALPLTPSSHPLPFSPRGSPSSVGDGDIHDDFCMVCRRSGQLLMCDTCSRVYHLDCLAPALRTVPRGMWICPSCQDQISKKEEAIDWPGPLAIVHSYISYKAEREQEKQKLEKWSSELRQEREELELRVKQLSDSITICRESRNGVLSRQKEMEASIEKVKGLVRLIRGIQLPCLPLAELPPAIMANGDLDRAATQQPGASSEVNQHPNVKCSLKDSTSVSRLLIVSGTSGNLGESVNLSGCLKDTGAAHTHSSASSPEPAVDATDGKSTSGSHQGSVTNNCAPLSNSHIKSTVVTSSNGALETEEVGHEESINKNNTNDINKNNADINKNIIRDLQGSPEPPLPAVMSLAEVIQGVE